VLARYQIVRGARAADDPLPDGIRQDTRKHTRHVARPSAELVSAFLRDPSRAGFETFRSGYLALLERRFSAERERFDAIAEQAKEADVFLGCNCPTAKQPDVAHCHTTLALQFFAAHYPWLRVRLPRP
jgi:uncharacterized protein YeaO (DUF488 family)